MKTFLALLFLASLSTSFAQESALYCKYEKNKEAVNLMENPEFAASKWECTEALIFGSKNNICFTGRRKPIIEALENGTIYISDEDRIERPWYKGKNQIQYTYVDVVGGSNHKVIINRCEQ